MRAGLNKIGRLLASGLCVAVLIGFPLSGISQSGDSALGVWKTQTNDEGSYLYVEIKPCDESLCGYIIEAYRKGDEKIHDYPNAGKRMLWSMKEKATGSWASGKIWAPDTNKTYRSKMSLQEGGSSLKVSGCVAGGLFCRSQKWTRRVE